MALDDIQLHNAVVARPERLSSYYYHLGHKITRLPLSSDAPSSSSSSNRSLHLTSFSATSISPSNDSLHELGIHWNHESDAEYGNTRTDSELAPAVPAKDAEVNMDETYNSSSKHGSHQSSSIVTTADEIPNVDVKRSSLPMLSKREQHSSLDSVHPSQTIIDNVPDSRQRSTLPNIAYALDSDSMYFDESHLTNIYSIQRHDIPEGANSGESQREDGTYSTLIIPLISQSNLSNGESLTKSTLFLPAAEGLNDHDSSDISGVTQNDSSGSDNASPESHNATGLFTPHPYRYYQPGTHAKAGPLPSPPRNVLEPQKTSPKPTRPPRLFAPGERKLRDRGNDDTNSSSEARPSSSLSNASGPKVAGNEIPDVIHARETADVAIFQAEDVTMTQGIAFDDGFSHRDSSDMHADTLASEETKSSQFTTIPDETVPYLGSSGKETMIIPRDSSEDFLLVSNENIQMSVPRQSTFKQVALTLRPPYEEERFQTSSLEESCLSSHMVQKNGVFVRPVRSRRKVKAGWPHAMHVGDVLNKRGSWERAVGYANKINELAEFDCGLGDWVVSMREKYSSPRQSSEDIQIENVISEIRIIGLQPRHSSHGSINSEMTFPRRPDAYVATDLSFRPIDGDEILPTVPSSLPYPTLARASTARNSRVLTPLPPNRGIPQISLNSKLSSNAFFSSIGRRTNSRRDRNNSTSSASKISNRLSTLSSPIPRPVQVTTSPSVPGGPRAIPVRSQSAAAHSTAHSSLIRDIIYDLPERRMSILIPPSAKIRQEPESADFDERLSKLTDVLPHVERRVLGNYLRSTDSDVAAIEQYLEDERNGQIRRG